jgi:CRP/FNR family cyclic AMP-dependent transcriptional regulator
MATMESVREMTPSRPSSTEICQVLREDPDLAEAVAPELRRRAVEECIAPVLRLRRGRWSGASSDVKPGGIGLLVLEGLLIRRVGVDGRFGAELLGEGDVIRPWHPEAPSALPRTTGWRAVEPACLAVLDPRVAHRMARYPELTGRLVGRALDRSRNLAVNMAIVHHARIDVRLHMLLWLLADRWGRVGREGVTIRLRLTHTDLADLVAARRPSVTTALTDLVRRGLVSTLDDGWRLLGSPPGELLEVRDIAVQSEVDGLVAAGDLDTVTRAAG